MRANRLRRTAGAVAAAAALVVAAGASVLATQSSVPAAAATRHIGLTTDQRLVSFPPGQPGNVTVIGAVSGLTGDGALVGIDFRVQDGKLYGVGDAGGVYILSTTSAQATKDSQLTSTLSGTVFGVDFNPAADRLRVVSDTGQNLRHDLNTDATTVDVGLSYTPPAAATGISAAAYTNNDLSTNTGTTLFDLDATLNQVAIQAPANNGTLSLTGLLTVDPGASAGFDIRSTLANGVTRSNVGYAALQVGGTYTLYQVELLTGQARLVGAFPTANQVVDLSFPTSG